MFSMSRRYIVPLMWVTDEAGADEANADEARASGAGPVVQEIVEGALYAAEREMEDLVERTARSPSSATCTTTAWASSIAAETS